MPANSRIPKEGGAEVDPLKISTARPGDVVEVVEVLTRAFRADPFTLAAIGPRQRYEKVVPRAFRVLVEECFLPYGRIDIARDGAGAAVGAAMWQAPGREPGWIATARMNARLLAAYGRSTLRVRRLERKSDKLAPRFPHWYLGFLGVVGEAQGKGVGGALLDHGIAEAGDHAAYLESSTPGSQALYERKGFIPMGAAEQGKPWAVVCMWRPGKVKR